jgi:hypothetical protein
MLTPFFSILPNYSSNMLKNPSGPSADGSFPGVLHPRDDDPSPACGPPSAEATGGGPKPFGGRRPEGFGPQGEEFRPDQIRVSRARLLSHDWGIGQTTRLFSILPDRVGIAPTLCRTADFLIFLHDHVAPAELDLGHGVSSSAAVAKPKLLPNYCLTIYLTCPPNFRTLCRN